MTRTIRSRYGPKSHNVSNLSNRSYRKGKVNAFLAREIEEGKGETLNSSTRSRVKSVPDNIFGHERSQNISIPSRTGLDIFDAATMKAAQPTALHLVDPLEACVQKATKMLAGMEKVNSTPRTHTALINALKPAMRAVKIYPLELLAASVLTNFDEVVTAVSQTTIRKFINHTCYSRQACPVLVNDPTETELAAVANTAQKALKIQLKRQSSLTARQAAMILLGKSVVPFELEPRLLIEKLGCVRKLQGG